MRLTSVLRSAGFGNLPCKVRGIVYYSLSPFEQRAFGGAISKGIPNLARRFKDEVGYVLPPFVIGYLIYDWAKKNHAYRQTKAGMIYYGEVKLIKKDQDGGKC